MPAAPRNSSGLFPPASPVDISREPAEYFLCLRLPHFGAQVLMAQNPHLKSKSFVTVKQNRDYYRSTVTAASIHDTRVKIALGSTVEEVRQRHPEISIFQEDPSRHEDYLRSIQKICETFSPEVDVPEKGIFRLNLSGTQRLYGEALNYLGDALREQIYQIVDFKYTALGSAHNPNVAFLCALRAAEQQHFYCPPGKEENIIRPIPVKQIPGIAKDSAQKLLDYNIQTLGECLALSRDQLAELVGWDGQKIYLMFKENWKGTNREQKGAGSLHASQTLSSNLIDTRDIKREVKRLTERLVFDLRQNRKNARTLCLTLRYSDRKKAQAALSRVEGYRGFDDILDTSYTLLTRAHRRRVGLQKIQLRASHLREDSAQTHLFENSRDVEIKYRLGRSLDRIRRKYHLFSVVNGDLI